MMMNTGFVPSGTLTLTHRARCSSVISSPSSFADSEVHHVVGVGGGEREGRECDCALSREYCVAYISSQNKISRQQLDRASKTTKKRKMDKCVRAMWPSLPSRVVLHEAREGRQRNIIITLHVYYIGVPQRCCETQLQFNPSA